MGTALVAGRSPSSHGHDASTDRPRPAARAQTCPRARHQRYDAGIFLDTLASHRGWH
jgi:hypothetical protein